MENQISIIVNGSQHEWAKEDITYGDVVMLAKPTDSLPFAYSMTYRKGRADKPEGILHPNESVKVNDGMLFNVYDTSNA